MNHNAETGTTLTSGPAMRMLRDLIDSGWVTHADRTVLSLVNERGGRWIQMWVSVPVVNLLPEDRRNG